MSNQLHTIFDLDGTTICSFHRVKNALNADGSFNLPVYLTECNKPEQIRQDSILPLGRLMQQKAANGEAFTILTARGLCRADIQFLTRHGMINYNTRILSRDNIPEEVKALPDGEYKVWHLNGLKSVVGWDAKFIMFDDNQAVLDALGKEENITMIDARIINKNILAHGQFQPLSNPNVLAEMVELASVMSYA